MAKLNIYQKPYKKRYATNFHLSKDEWIKLNSPKLRDEDLKEVKKKIMVKRFVFKFEFIVHLQTIKFIEKWDLRK